MNLDRTKIAALIGLACLLASACAPTPPPTVAAGGERAREAALAKRRPGEVSQSLVDPLARLANRYNTTNWSYPAAIDIDRDLARADPKVAGADAPITARIALADNLAAIGRLPEARATLDDAERTLDDQRGALTVADQRVLRTNLLIGRSILAGQEALRDSSPTRQAGFLEAADLAKAAIASTTSEVVLTGDAQAAAVREGDAIVLNPGKTAVYNASQRSNGFGDIVARPMTLDEKLLVLRIDAQFAEAAAYISAGRLDEARAVNRQAAAGLGNLKPGIFGWLRGEIAVQRATLDRQTGDYAGAKASLEEALAAVQKDQGQSRLEAFIWRAMAQLAAERGDTAAAKQAEANSFKILGDQTDGVPPSREEVAAYLALLAPAAVLGAPADSQRFFEVASVSEETATARTLADVAGRFAASDSASGAAIRRLQFARERVDRAQAKLARVRDPASGASSQVTREAEAEELDARRELADATTAAVAVGGSRAGALLSPRTQVNEVQAVLAPREAYVRFIFVGDGPGYAILVRKDKVKVVALRITEAQAAAKVSELRQFADQVAASSRLNGFRLARSHELYEDLFAGLAPDLQGIESLVIEPSGPLFSLPFAALLTEAPSQALLDRYVASRGADYTGAAWLARDKTLELSVGAAGFVRLRNAKASKAPRSILAFADPTPKTRAVADLDSGSIGAQRVTRGLALTPATTLASGEASLSCASEARAILDFPSLPDTLDEARTAITALGGSPEDVVSGPAFTDAAVVERKDLNLYRALLFATHAALPNQAKCWQDPFLITTKGDTSASDGVLETTEIANLDLDADLVVLSACNTGASDISGQALGGLAKSFIFAGSRGVVVSHWVANSKGAASLTSRMYSELGQGGTPALSLARAERAMMDDPARSHPYYWALFMVVGGAPIK